MDCRIWLTVEYVTGKLKAKNCGSNKLWYLAPYLPYLGYISALSSLGLNVITLRSVVFRASRDICRRKKFPGSGGCVAYSMAGIYV
jgi:hypothetical protein